MKFHKRQIILASLIVALGTAVYLNWQFSGNPGMEVTNMLDSSDELGEARYVNNSHFSDTDSELPNSNKISDSSTDSSPNSLPEKTKKYFAEAQVSRRKAHEETEEKLKSLISAPNINSDTKDEIKKSIDSLSKISCQESNIENLIKSKGFSECLAIIENGECNIIVNPGSVNEKSAIIIRDIVSSQSEIANNKIKIIEAK